MSEVWQITGHRFGQDFTAGLILEDSVCVKAAPILKKFVGQTGLEIHNSVVAPRWRMLQISEVPSR